MARSVTEDPEYRFERILTHLKRLKDQTDWLQYRRYLERLKLEVDGRLKKSDAVAADTLGRTLRDYWHAISWQLRSEAFYDQIWLPTESESEKPVRRVK